MGYSRNYGTLCQLGVLFKQRATLIIYALLIALFLISISGCTGNDKSAVPSGALRASPASHNFGSDLPVDVESTPKSFVITNTASVDVTDISYGLLNGQDKIFLVGSDCTAVLLAGATCNVTTAIKPDQKGKAFSETYFVKYLTENGEETLSIRLSGSTLSSAGVEIGDSLYLSGTDNPEDLSAVKTFPETTFGSVSDVATLGLTYQGAKPVVIQITPPTNRVFRVVNDCAVLASGERCNMFTSFAPVGVGAVESTINLSATREGSTTTEDLSVTLKGTGVEPTPIGTVVLYPEGNATATEINLGSANIGTLTTPAQNVVLENKSTTSYLYRLTSTVDSMAIDYGTCTGRLNGNESCTFSLTYGPSIVGSDEGYVSFVSGKSTAFIKVKGTATAGTQGGTGNVKTDKVAIVFPSTEIGFESEQKTVTITNTGTTPSGRITMRINGRNSVFSYQTTCVDNAPLRANSSCDVSVSFRPLLAQANNDSLVITVTPDGTAAETINVNLSGTGKPVAITDNTTNVNGLIISERKYNFPDTGVGLRSASYQFTLRNTGTEDITGFASTSTDLIRFSLDPAFTTCGSTIAAGSECKIAYRFNASAATQFRSFIKIHATGAEGAGVADAPELVELIGRGVLFNKYIYFGFVPKTAGFKDIAYAVVNDTNASRVITKTEVETVRWKWTARDNNPLLENEIDNSAARSTKMATWFPTKTSPITEKFTRVSSADGTLPQMFEIVTDGCAGKNISAGASCIIRLRYDADKQSDTDLTTKDPVSAYVRLYADDGTNTGTDMVIDQFHAVASGVDDVTYFFPPEDRIGSTTYERPIVIWDSQSVVIDQNIYTFSGESSFLTGGYSVDRKVRRYDAARNVWVELRTSGTDYPAIKWANGLSSDQVRMVAYNKKLYLYGGQVKGAANALLGLSDYLAVLDLDKKTADTDGAWSTLSLNALPGTRGQVNMAGFNNKIYLWGGLQQFSRNVLYFDLEDSKWYRAGQEGNASASVENIDQGCTIPQDSDTAPTRRGYAAFIIYGNKLFLHGGMHNTGFDNRGACGSLSVPGQLAYLYNDLWSYEVENYDDSGNPLHSADANKWKRLTDVIGGTITIGTNPQTSILDDDKRPFSREKHEWDIVGNKLLLKASGFAPSEGNRFVNVGPGNLYFFFTPDSGGKTETDPYNGWEKANIDTSSLAQHKLHIVDGAIWFYNKNIMGMQISSEIEALAKEKL